MEDTNNSNSVKNIIYMTKSGLDALTDELAERLELREKILNDIDEARRQGDLSENSQYTSAKENQSMNESRIAELNEIIRNAIVSESDNDNSDVVQFGSIVEVEVNGSVLKLEIVSEHESDLTQGKISDKSPIGSILLGAKLNSTVKLDVDGKIIEYKIKKIE